MDVSRRQFLYSSAGLALELMAKPAFASDSVFDLISEFFTRKISSEEYYNTVSAIESLGYKIDYGLSKFTENSKHLSIMLPDYHHEEYAEKQRKRIKELDSCLDLDAIGLEGVIGNVNKREMDRIEEHSKKCQYDYVNSLSEMEKVIFKTKMLNVNIFYDLAFMNCFKKSKIDPNAPGFLYYNVPTRTKKIGMESPKVYKKAKAAADITLCKGILGYMTKGLEYHESMKTWAEEQGNTKYANLLGHINNCLKKNIKIAQSLLEENMSKLEGRLKEKAKDYTLSMGFEDWLDEIIQKKRSQEWYNNLKNERIALLIGGNGHCRSYFNAAKDNSSVITLKKL